jgi:hypothetical protein
MKVLQRHRAASLGLVAATSVLALVVCPAPANASVTPADATLTIRPGETGVDPIDVNVPSPINADIEIAIDTTGSMGGAINQAKTQATDIVNKVQAYIPNSQFAIVEFKDSSDPTEYAVRQAMTANAAPVQAAINAMSASGGGDTPEAHNLVFHNSYSPALGGAIGWRQSATPIVVVISDAEPHGAKTSGMVDCADTSTDPHGYNTSAELGGMNANGRILFMVRAVATASTTLACYQDIATLGAPGSQAADLGTDVGQQIVDMLNNTNTMVSDVHLNTVSATPSPAVASWLSFSPNNYTGVVSPATLAFTINATVPPTTPEATYTFDVEALADGTGIGHHILTIIVKKGGARLTLHAAFAELTPPTGTMYFLTINADITDDVTGDPIKNALVDFKSSPVAGKTFPLCSDTSDNVGHLQCTTTADAMAATQLANGYDGFFAGNPAYNPTTAHGHFMTVNGNPFP